MPTVFYHQNLRLIKVFYVDDSIILGPTEDDINKAVDQLRKLKLELMVEGDVSDFLGVHIEKIGGNVYHLHQQHQIKRVINDLNLHHDNVKTKEVPCKISEVLKRDRDGTPFDKSFDYRSVIRKLNHIERCSRLNIAYIVHQCARFMSEPRRIHGNAKKWLERCLKLTKGFGYVIKPQEKRELEIYVDTDWSGNWDKTELERDIDTARSRYGFIIRYMGVVIFHASRLMQLIALSSTEAEYIGLSEAIREAIPLMNLLKECKELGFAVSSSKSIAKCKVFEDNSGALEIAKEVKYRSRTKHINCRYHHFCSYVQSGDISIEPIRSEDNPADILIHPVTVQRLSKHITTLMG